jgi:hypothetical protein
MINQNNNFPSPVPGTLYRFKDSVQHVLFFYSYVDPKLYVFPIGEIFMFLGAEKKSFTEKNYILLGADGRRYFVRLSDPPTDHPIFAESTTWRAETFAANFEKIATPTTAPNTNDEE